MKFIFSFQTIHTPFINHPEFVAVFTMLWRRNELTSYLAEVDRQADDLFSRLVSDMTKTEGVTEQLKSED